MKNKRNRFVRRWITSISIFTLIFTGFVFPSSAATTVYTSGDFKYSFIDNTNTIAFREYEGTASKLVIPTEIDGYKVGRINANILRDNSNVTEVVVKGGIEIFAQTFAGAPNLKTVTIEEGVKNIPYMAFMNCKNLETVNLPDSVESIGSKAFAGCISLQSIILPAGLKKLGEDMGADSTYTNNPFHGCFSLKTVNLKNPSGRIRIIDGCIYITDANGTPETLVAYIPGQARQSINVAEGTKNIGMYAFAGRSSDSMPTPQNVYLPSSVKIIGGFAFDNNSGLTKVTGGENIERIESSAFANCPSFTEMPLSDTIISLASTAFRNSPNYTPVIPSGLEYDSASGTYTIKSGLEIIGDEYYSMAREAAALVNKERANAGLGNLVLDEELTELAMQRAAETAILWHHRRPDYSTWDTILNGHVDPAISAENIAYDTRGVSYVMDGWMNSAGHRANILLSGATSMGIGCVKHNGIYYWVQIFTSSDSKGALSGKSDVKNKTFRIATSAGAGTLDPYIMGGDSIEEGKSGKIALANKNIESKNCIAVISNSDIVWTSSDPTVGNVTCGNTFNAITPGTVKITATLGGLINVSKTITVKAKASQDSGSGGSSESGGGANSSGSGESEQPETSEYTDEDHEAAANVIALIDAIPNTITAEAEDAVNEADKAYSKLTDKQKTLIDNNHLSKLNAAKNAIEDIAEPEDMIAYAKSETVGITLLKVKSKKKAYIKWTKADEASSYEVRYSLKKSFKSGVKKRSVKKNNITFTGLKANKKYYIQVRPVFKIKDRESGETVTVKGKWSQKESFNLKKKKTKKIFY